MSNKISSYVALLGLMTALAPHEAKAKPLCTVTPGFSVAEPDTVNYDDMEDGAADSIPKSRKNTATEFNALKYVLEHRYRNFGDQFTKRWNDHLFVEFGAGVYQELKGTGKALSPITTAHARIGKQFNRLHTARLTFGAGFGYYEGSKYTYSQLAASADWLFDFSSYICGYKPSRLLDVSSVIGAGIRYNNTSGNFSARRKYEFHGGVQMRFFTGPQGYLSLEPYIGISSRMMENKYGGFYGANLSVVYYLNNNLSIEERMRYMKNRPAVADSLLKPAPWRTPWFAEVAGGLSLFHSSGSTKLGHATALSFGKWFSPVVGVRVGGSLSSATWMQEEKEGVEKKLNRHNTNADARAEILINPFGFNPGYNWDSPVGMSVAIGGGLSWLMKNQDKPLHTTSTFYSAGLHLWTRLTDDLQFFVEPRYTNYNYKIPYTNARKVRRFSDDVYTLNIGLTAYTRGIGYRRKAPEYVAPAVPLSFGAGAGTSLLFRHNTYGGAKMNYNFNAFAEYHFTRIHGARLAFEYMSINGLKPIFYTSYDINDQKYVTADMYEHSHTRGFLSLDYLLNVTNLFSGYQGRRLFEGEMFAGPAIMFAMNSTSRLVGSTATPGQQRRTPGKKYYDKPLMGANGGIKLKCNVMRHLALTLTPQIHVLRYDPQLQGVDILKFRVFETLDFGLQYDL